jgi:hypothetical protein
VVIAGGIAKADDSDENANKGGGGSGAAAAAASPTTTSFHGMPALSAQGLIPPPQAADSNATTTTTTTTDATASTTTTTTAASSSAPLRRGKWTMEEEQYANRLILEFKAGLLPLADGTTLRTFLSRLLNCDPMRISKKFVGSNCIGKQVFRRRGAEVHKLTPDDLERTRLELCELERLFLERLSQSSSGKDGGGRGGGEERRGRGRGGGSGSSSKNSRPASYNMPTLGGGGIVGFGGGLSNISTNNNTNKSAAALGRAMLQGNNAPSAGAGLLAQMQSQNQRMNPVMSFLSLASQGAGGLGERACTRT